MPVLYDGEVRIVKVGPMGPDYNNAYILTDPETKEGVIIDAPAEPEKLLREIADTKVKAVIITHGHDDHVAGYSQMRQDTGVPFYVHPDDAHMMPEPAEERMNDGDMINVGKLQLKVIHTPGHTQGGVCLLVGKHLFAGDTLFPGGPGRTGSPEAFRQLKHSIETKLLELPDDTFFYPGHGDDGNIGKTRRDIQVFNSTEHPAHLCGDIDWIPN